MIYDMNYHKTDIKLVDNLDLDDIDNLYNQGYVLTRLPEMQQTRSLRIDLSKFELTSENRRVLRKTEELELRAFSIPIPQNSTAWHIHSLGKNFYQEKFDDVEFSANKIKEVVTNPQHTRFNTLFSYFKKNQIGNNTTLEEVDYQKALGFCIAYQSDSLLHYCYPFYSLDLDIPNLGMGMMLRAIKWAQDNQLDYVYLGSITRPKDTYKLQFKGLEWWDQDHWSEDLDKAKEILLN